MELVIGIIGLAFAAAPYVTRTYNRLNQPKGVDQSPKETYCQACFENSEKSIAKSELADLSSYPK